MFMVVTRTAQTGICFLFRKLGWTEADLPGHLFCVFGGGGRWLLCQILFTPLKLYAQALLLLGFAFSTITLFKYKELAFCI